MSTKRLGQAIQLRWDNWSEMCGHLGNEFFESGGCGMFGANTGDIALSWPSPDGPIHVNMYDWVVRSQDGELSIIRQ